MNGERPTRRSLLKGVAAGTTLAACTSTGTGTGDMSPDAAPGDAPQPIAPPEPIPQAPHFALGVSAGDLVGPRGVLWTQYTGTAPLARLVWRRMGDSYVDEHGPFVAEPSDAGFVHVPIDGLVAGARYRYA